MKIFTAPLIGCLALLFWLASTTLLAQDNLIANGEFDKGLTSWLEFRNDDGEFTTEVVTDLELSGENALLATITTPGPNPWSVGVRQELEATAQPDYTYTLNFTAKSTRQRGMTVQYKINGGNAFWTTFALTEEAQTFQVAIPSTEAGPMELLFMMGTDSGAVALDAVRVTAEPPRGEPEIPLGSDTATYNQVAIGGGGYVTGLYYHPTTPDLLYMRTDVGGPFRYDFDQNQWISLFKNFSDEQENYFGINALALAPSDDRYVYVAADKALYFDGPADVLVSKDYGTTWEPTGLNARFFPNGIKFGKVTGPALAVDPNDAERVYAGTNNSGLWWKDGAAAEWAQVTSVPVGQPDGGVRAIVFAPDGNDVFVGVPGTGVFRGTVGQDNFQLMEGAPTEMVNMAISRQRLHVAARDGLYFFDSTSWQVRQSGRSFSGVSIDNNDPNKLVAMEIDFDGARRGIFRSVDGGNSWSELNSKQGSRPGWFPEFFFSSAGSDVTLDPHHENAAVFCDYYAVWHTDDVTADSVVWNTYSRGHEETYITDLVSPPQGPRLMAGIADILGLQWERDLYQFPTRTITNLVEPLNNGTSIDYCASDPKHKVLAGNINNFGGQGYVATSDNNFEAWELLEVPDSMSMGRVAMSADDPSNMVIVTQGQGVDERSRVYFTRDGGASWQPSNGTPQGIIDNMFRARHPLSADRVDSSTFYLYVNPGDLYVSTDGGENFELVSSQLPVSPDFDGWEMKVRPDTAGEIWVSLSGAGLFRSTNHGKDFQRISGIQESISVGFGKGKSAGDPTVVYMIGTINNQEGIFYSYDDGQQWNKVADGWNWANGPRSLTADRQFYGHVYVGSDGSGILSVTLSDAENVVAGDEALSITLEAEDYLFSTPQANSEPYEWATRRYISGYTGSGYVTVPYVGNGKNTDFNQGARLDYSFEVGQRADYHLWVRRYARGIGTNSAFFGIDGAAFESVDNQEDFQQWQWVKIGTRTLEAGRHSLELVRREDAYIVDRFVVSTDDQAPTDDSANTTTLPVRATPNAAEGTLGVYPNPATGSLEVHLGKKAVREVALFNVQGTKVLSQVVNNESSIVLNVGALPPGLYLVKAFAAEATFEEKLIVN